MQRSVVRYDLKAAYQAAQRVHIGNARNGAQCRTQCPVQQRALLGQRQRIALDREHEHLAKRRGNRRQAAIGSRRQFLEQTTQPLVDLLARPIDVGAIVEVDRDIGDRVFGDRTDDPLVRNAQHLDFKRRHNSALDLFGRHAG